MGGTPGRESLERAKPATISRVIHFHLTVAPPTSLSDKIHNSTLLILQHGWAEEKLLEVSSVDPRCLGPTFTRLTRLVRSEPTTYIMPRRQPEFTHMCAAISAQ
ncbi:hypothetical protein PIB30_035116 [Stylosanthes scabra]|uniref:Uncharacterized protein n=1 Tax=Stylosanthes scabra TaxID=79078 RepID=A0ABU6SEB4_9FABA|nr:hypothetical protein [Stylosanthes scabra]